MVEQLVDVPVPSFHECSVVPVEQKRVGPAIVRSEGGSIGGSLAHFTPSGTPRKPVEVPQIQSLTVMDWLELDKLIEAGGLKMAKEKRERVVTSAGYGTDDGTHYWKVKHSWVPMGKPWLLQVAENSGTMTSAVFFFGSPSYPVQCGADDGILAWSVVSA